MNPKIRQSKILEFLKQVSDWITVKELANMFNVSERTIHHDLNAIAKILDHTNYSVQKKRGVGVKLTAKHLIDEHEKSSETKILSNRKSLILKLLLIDSRVVTYEELSKLFFVSTSSIRNDLTYIKKLLHKHTKVQLCSNNSGTRIMGTETAIREAIAWFNHYLVGHHLDFNELNINYLKCLLGDYYSPRLIDTAYDILFSYIKKSNHLLSDYYISNTLNSYIVQLHRLINDHTISTATQLDEYEGVLKEDNIEAFLSGAEELLSRASARLAFHYSNEEVAYLAKNLIVNRVEDIPSNCAIDELAEDLIAHLSETLKVNLNHDERLKKELVRHISPMIYRLKLGIKVNNLFVSQIKREFGETFYCIRLAIDRFEKELNIQFNDEEIALLTIYFQSAIERTNQNEKILIVCQHGMAISELLLNRLKNRLPSNIKIETASVGELEYFNLEEYEIVISTVHTIHGDNVMHVTPFLSADELQNISSQIQQKSLPQQETEGNIGNLTSYLDPKYIFIDTDYDEKKRLIETVLLQLIKDNFIHPSYVQSVFHREQLGNTDFPSGVAIPHGSNEYIKKSVIVIIQNKSRIYWSKYYVDKIFIPIISTDDLSNIRPVMKDIYHIIDNQEILDHFSMYLSKLKERLLN